MISSVLLCEELLSAARDYFEYLAWLNFILHVVEPTIEDLLENI
jgi:hypothetical protein